MNTTEQAFMRELKALLTRYDVTFKKDRVYYDGGSENGSVLIWKTLRELRSPLGTAPLLKGGAR